MTNCSYCKSAWQDSDNPYGCYYLFSFFIKKHSWVNDLLVTVHYVIYTTGYWHLPFFQEYIFYFALGPMVCHFTNMDKACVLFSLSAAVDEWKEKPLETQNTNETENASTHAMSELISSNIFPFQFPGCLHRLRITDGPLHISQIWSRHKVTGLTYSRWLQVTSFW